MQEQRQNKEYIHTIPVATIGNTRCWTVQLSNGDIIYEGTKGLYWPDIDLSKVCVVNVMGVVLPTGMSYTFQRNASMGWGGSPTVYGITATASDENISLIYKFILHKK